MRDHNTSNYTCDCDWCQWSCELLNGVHGGFLASLILQLEMKMVEGGNER